MEKPSAIRLHNSPASSRGYGQRLFVPFVLIYLLTLIIWPISTILGMPEWVSILLMGLTVLLFVAVLIAPWLTLVYLEREKIRIVGFGRTLQNMPVSRIRLICVVGNHSESVLCFSGYTVEQLAQWQEDRMRKSIFGRDELPFHKRNDGWQEKFANEYLNHLCWQVGISSPDQNLLFIPMGQISASVVRCMYPQIPFRNYEAPLDHVYTPNSPPVLGYQDPNVRVLAQEDGIWWHYKKEKVLSLPAEQIKAIVRVDRFTSYNKIDKHHSAFLVASAYNLDELAAQCRKMPEGIDQLPIARELRAAKLCLKKCLVWTRKTKGFLPMYYTAQREAELRRLYPQAQWIDLSKLWMENSGTIV